MGRRFRDVHECKFVERDEQKPTAKRRELPDDSGFDPKISRRINNLPDELPDDSGFDYELHMRLFGEVPMQIN